MDIRHVDGFRIELLPNDIVFVERTGPEANENNALAVDVLLQIARKLRKRDKPVLILNHAVGKVDNSTVMKGVLQMDYDKIACYGESKPLIQQIALMIAANSLDYKIRTFYSEKAALNWLHDITS